MKPYDEECIMELTKNHSLLVTMEENVLNGGFGENVLRYVSSLDCDMKVVNIAVPNLYLEHGKVEMLRKEAGIDVDSIVKKILERYGN